MIRKRVMGNGYRITEFLRIPYPLPDNIWQAGASRIPNPISRIPNPESGMALIIIMAIVAILSAIGITFMYTMRMEEKAAFNYMNSLKASYLAESGINHAVAILKSDGRDTGFVSYEGSRWGYQYNDIADSVFSAYNNPPATYDNDNCSVDNDTPYFRSGLNSVQGRDSRWIYVDDGAGNIIGRYAVLIIDESSKININTAGTRVEWDKTTNDPRRGWTPYEINLRDFFYAGSEADLSYWHLYGSDPTAWANTARDLADTIVLYRYGQNLVPGNINEDHFGDSPIILSDGIDNNADGIVDGDINDPNDDWQWLENPNRFIPWKPFYDINTGNNYDTAFITTEEVKEPISRVFGHGKPEVLYEDIKPYITVYSTDENTTDSGLLRLNINLLKDATALYTAMYEAWEDLFPGTYTYNELKQLAAQAAVNTIDYADTDNVSTFMNVYRSDSGRANRDSAGNWLRDTTKSAIWTGDEWIGAKITVISKTTKNRQVRTITGNTITRIDVEPNWDTGDNPLAGSYYYIEDKATARGVEAIRINEIMVKPAYQWNAEELFFEDLVSEGTPGWSDTDLYYSGISTFNTDTGIYSRTPNSQPNSQMEVDFEIWREGSYRVRTLTYATAPEYYTIATPNGAGNPEVPPVPTITQPYITVSPSPGWTDDVWIGATVVIASGTDLDQKRKVIDNTSDTLIVDANWNPIPDDGSQFSVAYDHSFNITFESNEPDAVFEIKGQSEALVTAGVHNIGGWLLEDLGVIEVKEPGEGKIILETSQYTNANNVPRLDYIQLSQQPDCEYVELLNISDKEVDISEWTLATSAGFTATIPEGTKIGKGDYLVLAVDKADGMWAGVDKKYIPDSIRHLAEGKDEICFEETWPNSDKVVQLPLIPSPVYISEKGFGDTVILPGSVFTDLPPEPPMKWEENGYYDSVGVSTLTDNGALWDVNQWKGATITANINLSVDGDTQITRQIASNDANAITLTTKWSWDQNVNPAATPTYYIHFDPMSVTLYEGLLADQQIVSQVNYLPQDIENQVAYEQENDVPVYGFVALEKDDPTAVWDRNNDGIDDLWNLNLEEMEPITIGGESIRGGTPAYINSVVDPQNRDIVEDIGIPNLPFATVGDIKDVSLIRVNDYADGFASDGGTDTLEDDDSPWISHEWQNAVIVLVSGKGAGQIRFIDDNTTDEITVTEYWDIIPNATSEYAIFFQWSKIGYDDLGDYIELVKRIADKITVSQKRLEAEKAFWQHVPGPSPADDWVDTTPQRIFLTPSYYVNDDAVPDTWWWGIDDRIQPSPATGIYDLYIKGMLENDNGFVEVAVTTAAGTDTQLLQFSPDGTAYFGQIQIAGPISGAPSLNQDLLAVCVTKRNAGADGAYFDAVVLTPERRTYGRINIDTADTVVLMSLPGIDQNIAQAIIDYRENPYGYDGEYGFAGVDDDDDGDLATYDIGEYNWPNSDDGPFNDIGEILNVQVSGKPAIDLDAFSKISNLITTKSKIFTIISTGQALRESDRADVTYQRPTDPNPKTYEILGEKKYMVVIER